jgi:glycerol-3-phosphate dehydrogenase (NAD(P)+)
MNRIVAVLGAGAWGTALAIQAARAGSAVRLWARDPAIAAAIGLNRTSARLPGVALPAEVTATGDIAQALDGAAAALLAVPAQHLRDVVGLLPEDAAPVVICAKGIETGTLLLPMEIVAGLRPRCPVAVLSGPNFAAEIAAGQPAAAVLAATDGILRAALIGLLATPGFRLYGNDDVVGVQVGGAAKNVIAIAAGIVIGAGFVTRSIAELARLVIALGGRADTVMGLSGLGDLLLTCTGASSRNYSLGVALGQGRTLPDILGSRSAVTEGVATAPALLARAAAVDMPVCAAVTSVLDGRATPRQAMSALLSRRLRDE